MATSSVVHLKEIEPSIVQITLEADWQESGTQQSMTLYRLLYQDPDAPAATTGATASGQ